MFIPAADLQRGQDGPNALTSYITLVLTFPSPQQCHCRGASQLPQSEGCSFMLTLYLRTPRANSCNHHGPQISQHGKQGALSRGSKPPYSFISDIVLPHWSAPPAQHHCLPFPLSPSQLRPVRPVTHWNSTPSLKLLASAFYVQNTLLPPHMSPYVTLCPCLVI